MLKIEIKSDAVSPRTITPQSGKNAGKPMTFHEQEGWVFLYGPDGKPHPYPQKIVLNIDVDKGHKPYPPGVYQVSPMSFYVNRFDTLDIGRMVLERLGSDGLKAAA